MNVTPKDLLDAGVHFGHQTKRWNPRSKPYVFDHRQGITIIDLGKTHELLQKAYSFLEETVAGGGNAGFHFGPARALAGRASLLSTAQRSSFYLYPYHGLEFRACAQQAASTQRDCAGPPRRMCVWLRTRLAASMFSPGRAQGYFSQGKGTITLILWFSHWWNSFWCLRRDDGSVNSFTQPPMPHVYLMPRWTPLMCRWRSRAIPNPRFLPPASAGPARALASGPQPATCACVQKWRAGGC